VHRGGRHARAQRGRHTKASHTGRFLAPVLAVAANVADAEDTAPTADAAKDRAAHA
jgi:hypothetical protein